jgi:hypothetical protein
LFSAPSRHRELPSHQEDLLAYSPTLPSCFTAADLLRCTSNTLPYTFRLSLHRAAGPPPPSTYPIPWQPNERGETPEMSVFTGDPDPDRPPSSTLWIPIQPKRARVAWLGGMRFTTAREVDNGMDINTPVQTPIRNLAAKVRVCIQDFGLRQNSESDISYTDHGSLSALDMNYAALGAS